MMSGCCGLLFRAIVFEVCAVHIALSAERSSDKVHAAAERIMNARARISQLGESLRALGNVELGADSPLSCHPLRSRECANELEGERAALEAFLRVLGRSPEPPEDAFNGRGVVMTFGIKNAPLAAANLQVLRGPGQVRLPVEVWHAFELPKAICDELKMLGATCHTLPGVFAPYQTILPAILASSFEEVIYIDSDVLLIDFMRPLESIFATRVYTDTGALLWPDYWGAGCKVFGWTAWPNHVLWDLLGLEYKHEDPMFTREHETSFVVVDKQRHWKQLLLANYFLQNHFWQRIIVGEKDTYRLAWLVLDAPVHVCPRRPGHAGFVLPDGQFVRLAMLHFRPESLVPEEQGAGLHWPMFFHQLKTHSATLARQVVEFNWDALEAHHASKVCIVEDHFGPMHLDPMLWTFWKQLSNEPIGMAILRQMLAAQDVFDRHVRNYSRDWLPPESSSKRTRLALSFDDLMDIR